MTTGYEGEEDLDDTVEDTIRLAESIAVKWKDDEKTSCLRNLGSRSERWKCLSCLIAQPTPCCGRLANFKHSSPQMEIKIEGISKCAAGGRTIRTR